MYVIVVFLLLPKIRGEADGGAAFKGNPTYFPWSCAEIVFTPKGKEPVVVGTFGIMRPEVLKSFDQSFPISAVEMNLEPFV